MTAVVEAESLTKRFGEVSAVTDLSFVLEARTITGFLGPNDAGKTTTLRMILGLAAPTSGRALVFDKPYAELARPALRVGAVLEATDFHPPRPGPRTTAPAAASNRDTTSASRACSPVAPTRHPTRTPTQKQQPSRSLQSRTTGPHARPRDQSLSRVMRSARPSTPLAAGTTSQRCA